MKSMLRATFAAGCYWGTEKFFRLEFGDTISEPRVGFTGGGSASVPVTYKDVCKGHTGHAEVLTFEFDPHVVDYDALLLFFFRIHDCTDRRRKDQYRTAIFYHTDEQKQKAEALIAKLNDKNDPTGAAMRKAFGSDAVVATRVEKATEFYPAHGEHQDYLNKRPTAYCAHRLYW
jgi:peptide-methionine (S)-S-oxide reductase